MTPVPMHNFSGRTALVLHRSPEIGQRIRERCDPPGVRALIPTDDLGLDTARGADTLILDIDTGDDGRLPWPRAAARMPLIGLIGSESPGRPAWALAQEVDAFIPVSGLGLSADMLARYPHEFSGGQRQRVCIARALSLAPKVIVAYESVSALDVSVQAQVLDLLQELQDADGLSYLFISHDMAVVDQIADRVMVLRLGQVMEERPRDAVLHDPQHGYTRRLLSAVPVPDPARHRPFLPPAPEGQGPVLPFGDSFRRVRLETVPGSHRVARTA